MPINKQSLKQDGFTGFRPIAELEINRIPQKPGIFAVLRPEGGPQGGEQGGGHGAAPRSAKPQFLAKSTAGIFKKKDPTLKPDALGTEWVDGADVLYVGKAGPGSKGNRGLRRQIQEFVDFGRGKPPGHWDGRLIWQLADARTLNIAWKELPVEQLAPAEAGYHAAFAEEYGRLPFANLVQARVKGS
ncbi:hypothetical protein [Arthrobacter sp. Soil763]|uniref:hypothetical protein n=1 Tax=Arthrobacter sp. Soil763 TaxID=1736402 RepID=UPI000701FFC7|nr:hypothetical protein [Arthrobacter sp. Soil763]KRE82097.1 hypothetical protein ASG71_03380 [Arthrobacter sp. Soil763]